MRLYPWIILLALALIPCGVSGEPRFELTVLGVAQDGGVPHVGCFEPCCVEARKSGTALGPACLGIRDRVTGKMLLVEATPAMERQLAFWYSAVGTTRSKASPVDAVLLTHAHMGHYLGLAHFGREVAGSQNVPVYASRLLGAFLEANGPWSQLVRLGQIAISPFEPGVLFEPLPGLRVLPIQVPHRDEFSDTMAYKFLGPSQTVLFVPDVDNWSKHPGLLEQLLEGVDVAYLDGTFWDGSELPDRDIAEVPHPPMTYTMELLRDFAENNPGSIRFIHLNHSNPALRDTGIKRSMEMRGFRVAQAGEKVAM